MGQVLHPNAVTAQANRKEIQEAPVSISNRFLARRFGINYRTVRLGIQNGSVILLSKR